MTSRDIYVFSAIPPKAKSAILEHGLLSAEHIARHPTLLKIARPTKKEREDFVKSVEKRLAGKFPESVLGPSVFFTEVDESKITKDHFIKKWKLKRIRINLSALLRAEPDTIIFGVELLPITTLSFRSKAFKEHLHSLGFDHVKQLSEARRRPLTLKEVRAYTKKRPEELWEWYDVDKYSGRFYAADVPHAFIITPSGVIPSKFIEFLS
jgi:hypothetical protein